MGWNIFGLFETTNDFASGAMEVMGLTRGIITMLFDKLLWNTQLSISCCDMVLIFFFNHQSADSSLGLD